MPPRKSQPAKPKAKESWGGVADWYDAMLDGDDTYQTQVILPNVMRVLALAPGERVIDIACGQGFFSRACAEAGALVVGADISHELIAIAREKSPTITFHIAASDALTFARDGEFDTALIILAIQNIEKMDATFAEAKRVLKPGGRLLLVLNHPAFRVLKNSSWGYDEAAKVQYRRVDRYLSAAKVAVEMHPGHKAAGKGGAETLSYHRSLQDLSKSLIKNGFAITRLEEWISHRASGKGPRQAAEDTARKEIPLFLALETRRLS